LKHIYFTYRLQNESKIRQIADTLLAVANIALWVAFWRRRPQLFFRSWKFRLFETCSLFDVLFRPINNNARVFDVCCILLLCWHWKLCHYL